MIGNNVIERNLLTTFSIKWWWAIDFCQQLTFEYYVYQIYLLSAFNLSVLRLKNVIVVGGEMKKISAPLFRLFFLANGLFICILGFVVLCDQLRIQSRPLDVGFGLLFLLGGVVLVICQLSCQEYLWVASRIPRMWFAQIWRRIFPSSSQISVFYTRVE